MPLVNFHSGRVKDPGLFLEKPLATIIIKPEIELVTGKLKTDGEKGPMVAQSYRFDIDKFTVQQAKQWLKKHKVKAILFEPAKPKPKEEVKETTMVANIAAKVSEKCWGSLFPKKKKKEGMMEQKGEVVAASNGSPYEMKGSYESLSRLIRKALQDSQLYGKYPEILSTFPKKVFVSTDDNRYFMIEYTMQGDEVKLGIATEIEKQVKFIIKECAEQVKVVLFAA
jgi:hypothetical protein